MQTLLHLTKLTSEVISGKDSMCISWVGKPDGTQAE